MRGKRNTATLRIDPLNFDIQAFDGDDQPVERVRAAEEPSSSCCDDACAPAGKRPANRFQFRNEPFSDTPAQGKSAVRGDSAWPAAAGPAAVSADQDAVSALIALGYKPPEASRMVSKVFEDGMDTEMIIRAALKGTAG